MSFVLDYTVLPQQGCCFLPYYRIARCALLNAFPPALVCLAHFRSQPGLLPLISSRLHSFGQRLAPVQFDCVADH